MLRELEFGRGDGEGLLAGGHAGEALALADGVGEFFAAEFEEVGLVVEEIHLRRRAGLEEVDDAFGFGGEVGNAGECPVEGLVAGAAGGDSH